MSILNYINAQMLEKKIEDIRNDCVSFDHNLTIAVNLFVF